jgi:hypothetical protein
VDAVLCSVPTGTQESQSSPSPSLRVWLGVVTTPLVIRISHREYLVQHQSASLPCVTSIDTSTPERALPGWYGTCLYNGCIADALTQTTNELEVLAIGSRPPTRIDLPATRHREHNAQRRTNR